MQVKAMELIDELEVTRRGAYSSGFGGIAFNGDMDIALALSPIDPWVVVLDKSKYVDQQTIKLQENPEVITLAA